VDRVKVLNTAAGIVLGAAALLFAILAEKPVTVVPFALMVLAGLALASLAKFTPVRVAGAVTVAVALAGAGVVFWLSPRLLVNDPVVVVTRETVHVTPPVPTAATVTVVAPDVTKQVTGCFVVKFVGTPPPDYGFAVATNTDTDARLYYEGIVKQTAKENEWAAQITVGSETEGLGATFHVFVVAIEKRWIDYLSGTRFDEGATWWTSMSTPPGSIVAARFDVRRENSPSMACP
jgi:hypothetical protein